MPQNLPGAQGSGANGRTGANRLTSERPPSWPRPLLVQSHYLNRPIDAEMSGKLFDEYLDSLDPRHLYFLDSDVKEFEPLRATLGDSLSKKGDVSPAFTIFNRLLQRIDEENAYALEAAQNRNLHF